MERWQKPEFEPLSMSAGVGAYQGDPELDEPRESHATQSEREIERNHRERSGYRERWILPLVI